MFPLPTLTAQSNTTLLDQYKIFDSLHYLFIHNIKRFAKKKSRLPFFSSIQMSRLDHKSESDGLAFALKFQTSFLPLLKSQVWSPYMLNVEVQVFLYFFSGIQFKTKEGKKKLKEFEFAAIKYFSYIPETSLSTGYPITSVALHKSTSNRIYFRLLLLHQMVIYGFAGSGLIQ